MARIAGINVPPHKHTVVALTHIFGIGRSTAGKICSVTAPALEVGKIGQYQDMNKIAMLPVPFRLLPTDAGNDDVTFIFK